MPRIAPHTHTMQVTTNWNIGQFGIALSANVDDAMRDRLATLGLRYLGQRNSEVDKVLGGFEKNAEGKMVRKANFKRNEVAFTPELADALAATFGELSLPKADGEEKAPVIAATVLINQYEGSTATIKYAGERKAYARHGVAGDLEAFAAKVGYEGEVGDGTAENAPVEFLQAIKKFVDSL